MDIRRLTEDYAVSPQIDPEDLKAIKDAGFGTVICNRPDEENPPSHHASVLKSAAEAAGLKFFVLPITHQTMSVKLAVQQRDIVDVSDEPTFAYCASGTRCSIIWALGQAKDMDAGEIIQAAAEAGYDLSGMRPTLEALAQG